MSPAYCLGVVCLQGTGSSDFLDALTVAVDSLHTTIDARPELGKANVVKRVVLVSNFLDAAKEDPDDVFVSTLVTQMQNKGVRMEVCCACFAMSLIHWRVLLCHACRCNANALMTCPRTAASLHQQ